MRSEHLEYPDQGRPTPSPRGGLDTGPGLRTWPRVASKGQNPGRAEHHPT